MSFAAAQAPNYIDSAKTTTEEAFKDLKNGLINLIMPPAPGQPAQQQNLHSPQANYGTYHYINAVSVNSSATQSKKGATKALAVAGGSDPLSDLLGNIVIPAAYSLTDKLGNDAEALLNLIKSGSMDDLKKFVIAMLDTVLGPMEQLTEGVLNVFMELVGGLEGALQDDLGLPIIGALYEFITALLGDEEDFTILNGLSFVTAIVVVTSTEVCGLGELSDYNSIGVDSANFPTSLLQDIPSRKFAARKLGDPSTFGQMDSKLKAYTIFSGIAGSICTLMGNITSALPSVSFVADLQLFFSCANVAFSFPMPMDNELYDTWGQRIGS